MRLDWRHLVVGLGAIALIDSFAWLGARYLNRALFAYVPPLIVMVVVAVLRSDSLGAQVARLNDDIRELRKLNDDVFNALSGKKPGGPS